MPPSRATSSASASNKANAALALLVAISSSGCSLGEEIAPAYATVLGYEQVVPFESPPENVITQNANNNLDVAFHEGRVYLAFRTAPSHFASEKTEIIVLLQTKNGLDLEPFIPGKPIVDEGGGPETDFVFLDNGDLIAVERNEAGDELGWGSKNTRFNPNDAPYGASIPIPSRSNSRLIYLPKAIPASPP